MKDYYSNYVFTMDTNDVFVHLGFCPEKVKITKLSDGQDNLWCRLMGNDASLSRVAAGDRTANTDKGIKLVQFPDGPLAITADPSAVDPAEFYKANGIQITADVGFLADDNVVLVEAWRIQTPILKITHDGGDNCNAYCQDASFDFLECGVSGNQAFIAYNLTNGNYAYVGEVQKPSGQGKHCRLTLTDAAGNAMASADVDDNDVLYIVPVGAVQYPLSDLGIMS